MSVNDLLQQMTEAGDAALKEVQLAAGWSTNSDEPSEPDDVNRYIEALEDAVRANAGSLRLAAMAQGR